ncbi:MAG: minor capsid protein [Sandarakinorhabdus sp.]|nr:minor capsid protein [Sandarakinorhabdus sp.]
MSDDEPIAIRTALDLRPDDALRAFRARDELAISVSYRDLEPEEHARAFTVAKVAKLDLLADIGGSLDTALKEGQTFEMWKAGIQPQLEKAGWWGMVRNEELTGTDRQVFVGERRLRTIFDTNMRVSRAAGQWARIRGVAERRPFLQYSAVLDRRVRPEHARWHNIILPVNHPLWQRIFPPNGWNCRCSVIQWSQRDLDRQGFIVTPDDQLPELLPSGQTWFAGEPRETVQGIDPGWDYNPGEQSLQGLAEKAITTILRAEDAGLRHTAADTLAEIAGNAVVNAMLLRLLQRLAPNNPRLAALLKQIEAL